jgi:hypothetical protein
MYEVTIAGKRGLEKRPRASIFITGHAGMDTLPEHGLSAEIRTLRAEEARLEADVHRAKEALSGLRDIDAVLSLAAVKLSLCLRLMKSAAVDNGLAARITTTAREALRLVEGLLAENVSEDQKGIVQSNPLYEPLRARLEEFLLAGGSGYLEAAPADARARRLLSRTIVSAIRKFAGPDDRSPPLDLEDYPQFVREALLSLFPVMVRENPQQPPYGIEEGQEVTYSSRNMKLPLSQAIFYMENELLPELERRLAESPGSTALQEEIRGVRERMEDYRKLRFFPRSTPVLLEKGYYTEGMTGYTADGEMLVPIPLPVTFRSGTNLDRVMEQVRMDVVRRIAGRGVSTELDREYRHLRGLESGRRGSSRTASMKLDTAWGYRVVRQEFPFLARLSDKKKFEELVSVVQDGRGSAERRIDALIAREGGGSLPAAGS